MHPPIFAQQCQATANKVGPGTGAGLYKEVVYKRQTPQRSQTCVLHERLDIARTPSRVASALLSKHTARGRGHTLFMYAAASACATRFVHHTALPLVYATSSTTALETHSVERRIPKRVSSNGLHPCFQRHAVHVTRNAKVVVQPSTRASMVWAARCADDWLICRVAGAVLHALPSEVRYATPPRHGRHGPHLFPTVCERRAVKGCMRTSTWVLLRSVPSCKKPNFEFVCMRDV